MTSACECVQRQNTSDQEVRTHEVESLERKLTEAEREAAAANVSKPLPMHIVTCEWVHLKVLNGRFTRGG